MASSKVGNREISQKQGDLFSGFSQVVPVVPTGSQGTTMGASPVVVPPGGGGTGTTRGRRSPMVPGTGTTQPTLFLVRCADCVHIRYHSDPYVEGEPCKEWLTCEKGKKVTTRGVRWKVVKCPAYEPRMSSTDRMRCLPLVDCGQCKRSSPRAVLNFLDDPGTRGPGCTKGLAYGGAVYCVGYLPDESEGR